MRPIHIAILILFFTWVFKVDAVTLLWDENPIEDRVSAYRVYYGESSRAYTQVVEVRNGTSQFFSNDLFLANKLYYFAVTAFRDDDGLESDYSNEVTWLEPMKLRMQNSTIIAKVSPGNYLLEGTTDFQSWFGVEARTTNGYSESFNVTFDEAHKFFRLKKLEDAPMMAMASASRSMEKGLLVSVTELQTLKTKEKLSRKIKRFFKYKPGMPPVKTKGGAEMLMYSRTSRKPILEVGAPIPPPMPRLK